MKTKKDYLNRCGSRCGSRCRNLVLCRFTGQAQSHLRHCQREQRRYFKFGHCYRNHRTGDGSRSRYAGFWYHRQDLRRLQLGSNQRTVDCRNGPCHIAKRTGITTGNVRWCKKPNMNIRRRIMNVAKAYTKSH